MDIEKLIEQLKRNTDCWTDKVHGYADLRLAAATALSTLQAENEKLRAELDEKEKYYDQMIDALAATDSAELEQVKREKIRIPEGYALVKLELLEELDNFRELGPIGRLRELKQADDEGRCVMLPAAPDQTIYRWRKGDDCPSVSRLDGVQISGDGEITYPIWCGHLTPGDFGKTVFLTREEAEAALRREQDG